jgi:hypothetical protein
MWIKLNSAGNYRPSINSLPLSSDFATTSCLYRLKVLRSNHAIGYYCFIQYAILGGCKFLEAHKTTEGSCLMRISLLRFFKKIHKFAFCEFMPYALSYFISLVRFFGYFCPIWLMRIFYRTKSRIKQESSVLLFKQMFGMSGLLMK